MPGYKLVFFSPVAGTWQQFLLPTPQPGLTLSIGRAPGNTLVINDPSVSSMHAQLMLDPQGFFILDQNSHNGVLLNGQLLPPNQWIPLAPGASFTLGETTCRVEAEAVTMTAPSQIGPHYIAPITSQPVKRRSALPFVLGAIGLLILVTGGVLLLTKGSSSVNLPITGASLSTHILPLNADGSTQTDQNGVSVTVPEGAVTEGTAQLSSSDLPKEMAKELAEGYELVTPAYSLTVQGAEDGSLPVELAFPAEDKDLRLMAIIDGTYAAELALEPQDGLITLPADLRPSDLGDLADSSGMWQTGTIQYVLVKPKAGSQGRLTTTRKLAAPANQAAPDRCFSLTRTRCWQNGNGSVQLMMDKDISLTPTQSEAVINYIQSTMDKFETLGFDGAIYTASNPVQVVVTKGAGTPAYVVSNGVIYLPNDIASKIAAGGSDDFLIHEMAHWIQDESYNFTAAYYFEADTWWIETSAENMVMLVDPTYVSRNLQAYGEIDANEKQDVLQSSPFQWPMSEFYVQAQQVKVNICPSGCPLTQDTFVSAINNGTYPYADDATKAKLHANLADYARYLLGVAPLSANTTIPLDGVLTGEGYGDHILVKRTVRSEFDMKDQVGAGRLIAEDKDSIPGTLIETSLQKDGVYVLRIELATGEMSPQWPAVLRVEPGAPFYYRLNDGEVQYHDGKTELLIQPIMRGAKGDEITKVRLAAVGMQGGEVFKAHLSMVDLSGMWVMDLPDESTFINHIICEKEESTADFVIEKSVGFTSVILMLGDFKPDITSHLFTWSVNEERGAAMLGGLGNSSSDDGSDSSFTAAATLDQGIIHLEGTDYEAEDTTFNLTDEGEYYHQYISVPGTFQFKADFDTLTYVGTEATEIAAGLPNQLAWELSGEYIFFIVDCTFLDQRVSAAGQLEEENREHCSGSVEVPATIQIYQPKK